MEKIIPELDEMGKFIKDQNINPNFIEIEGRLGRYDPERRVFDSNISKEYYDKIQFLLESCKEFTVEQIDSKDFYDQSLRLTVLNENNSQTKSCIEKTSLKKFTFTFEQLPMDIRISVSQEIPKKVDVFPIKKTHKLYCRQKMRTRYKLHDFAFDLTQIIEFKNEKEPKEHYKLYEYEIEYHPNSGNGTGTDPGHYEYILQHIFVKLVDAIYYCDNDFIKTKDNVLDMTKLFPLCLPEKL